MKLLPIEPAHVFALDSLPALHRDPFDRMLVAQASVESLCLVSKDEILKEYPIEVKW